MAMQVHCGTDLDPTKCLAPTVGPETITFSSVSVDGPLIGTPHSASCAIRTLFLYRDFPPLNHAGPAFSFSLRTIDSLISDQLRSFYHLHSFV